MTALRTCRRLAVTFFPLSVVLATLYSAFAFLMITAEAFEKWELPLGWNPQYGPRYVVFWGGPSGHENLSLGTCRYEHYATIPTATSPPLASYKDFYFNKLFEEAQPEKKSFLTNDEKLIKLSRLPFYDVGPEGKYALPEGEQLPFTKIQNPQMVIRAAKTIAAELIRGFVKRLEGLSTSGDKTEAEKVEAEGARLYMVILAVHEAMKKLKERESEQREADLLALLNKVYEVIKSQSTWDGPRFAYWLDASRTMIDESASYYYVAELERSLWQSALAALSITSPPADSSYGWLLQSGDGYKDCEHFILHKDALVGAHKELLCEDAFIALSIVIYHNTETLSGISSEKGKGIFEQAKKKLLSFIAAVSNTMKSESPFYQFSKDVAANKQTEQA